MAAQWDEEQKLEEILEKGPKEKKNISGWSMKEMKKELSVAQKEDAEEVKNWRGLSQSEIDQAGKMRLKEWKRKS